MLPTRAISRAASRLTLQSSSRFSRPLISLSKPRFPRPAWKITTAPTFCPFSTSSIWREPARDTDQELSAKLNLEVEIEQSSRDSNTVPESIQAFLDESGFGIQDIPGSQDVVLTKTFENETIKVEFSIADINNMTEELDDLEDEDVALDDEDLEPPAGANRRNINHPPKGGKIDVVPEDSIAPADLAARGEETESPTLADEDSPLSVPINLQITITKPNGGALQIHARADDGMIQIGQVSYYPSAKLADSDTPEAAKEAASLYPGPPFGNLDADLGSMMERYIDERGINADLALFLPEYVDYKEQREYVQWLQNVKKFVDA